MEPTAKVAMTSMLEAITVSSDSTESIEMPGTSFSSS